ncbi:MULTISPECIES: ATP-binding protein [Streptomyces]|uniref:ATP-binding protein n=1 Tax=Streptomyces TaxID=1883 RepID=UPI001964608D|nr:MULTISPECIES: ATP-binding protein [Streptomyces]QRX91905.1 ATP-binding protein [Streptomyces noursei]UJB41678.1 ATP-binding protein [Streptomyces sp. A1-5]
MPAHTTLPAAQTPAVVRTFTQRFSSTRLGARLARRLAVHRLDVWGFPYGSGLSDSVGAIVAELAANAVLHGHVRGRDFELRLASVCHADPGAAAACPGTLRIDVADTRSERRPPAPDRLMVPTHDAESGRGLLVVAALASRWTVFDRDPIGKVVRAELDLVAGR